MVQPLRIGIDLGGTKIAGVALSPDGDEVAANRVPTPRHDYAATIAAIADLIERLEQEAGAAGTIGVGIPGSLSPRSGVMQNSNSVWLNGRPFHRDLEHELARQVRMANDANCFALSEAVDGAAESANCVFGVILGTGCGGGIVIDGTCVSGPRSIGGEWGHTPLPWSEPGEHPGPQCWCGRLGCMETWVSGTALARDHLEQTGEELAGEDVVALATQGNTQAMATLDRHATRLARGLAMVVNIIDPDIIVLGGGLSNLPHLYEKVPGLMEPYVFADHCDVRIVAPRHGDASGVRGAARLWPA